MGRDNTGNKKLKIAMLGAGEIIGQHVKILDLCGFSRTAEKIFPLKRYC